jgi:hypothetical protein
MVRHPSADQLYVWCQLRKYPKDVQRAVFQPVTLPLR